MAVTSFQQVKDLINQVLTANSEIAGVAHAPHKSFWDTLSYIDFTTGNVPHVTDQGQPIRILIPGQSAQSNLIQALKGIGIFDPNTGTQDRMPANGPPWFNDQQVQDLADWIDNGCPEGVAVSGNNPSSQAKTT